ncbi:MAG: hypothetical protein ACRYG8_22035, partial [Janthinobacterium lividum]
DPNQQTRTRRQHHGDLQEYLGAEADACLPACQRAEGVQAVRTTAPMMIASTKLSNQAGPNTRRSIIAMSVAAPVTKTHNPTPGSMRRTLWKAGSRTETDRTARSGEGRL